jgi:hypothetical protein
VVKQTLALLPYIGELGWEMSRWAGFCRFWRETKYPRLKCIVASFPGREPFYKDFCDQFIPLPQWFLDKKYEVDCYESVGITPQEYADLLNYFKQFYNPETTIEIRPPRGCNYILPQSGQQKVIQLRASNEAFKAVGSILQGHPHIVVSARGRARAAERNWPEENWIQLINQICNEKEYIVVIVGAPSGSSLNGFEREGVLNLMDKVVPNQAIDLSLALFNSAVCSITSQSGSTHLSLQAGCPSLIIGHEMIRHSAPFPKGENYLKAPTMFVETLDYRIDSQFVFDTFKQFTDILAKGELVCAS